MNEAIKEIEHDDNCLWSYIGSLIGGIVGVIPWIVLYYFYSINLFFLSALIPIFSVFGYKYFKGIVNSKTFNIIAIISIIIFFVSVYLVFPYYLAKKNNIEFNDFNHSEYYQEYYDDILNILTIEIICMIIGLIIAYVEVSRLLKRYKLTNNMIKDTNTFIREDNNPIDSDDYNGIIFPKEKIKPVREKGDFNNFDNKKIVNSTNLETKVILYVFIVLFMIFPFFAFLFNILEKNHTYDQSKKINDNNYNDIDIDLGYDFSNDYKLYDEYFFEMQRIKVTIPFSWVINRAYDTDVFFDKLSEGSIHVSITNAIGDLKNFHEKMVIVNANLYEVNPFYTTINGHEVYYSINRLDNGYNCIVYTMKYNNYYITIIDEETLTNDFSDYNFLLSNIEEY